MAAEIADVANFDCQVLARLPLDVESVVDGVGQFVGAIVGGKGEQRRPCDACLLRSGRCIYGR